MFFLKEKISLFLRPELEFILKLRGKTRSATKFIPQKDFKRNKTNAHSVSTYYSIDGLSVLMSSKPLSLCTMSLLYILFLSVYEIIFVYK